jgi:hypothetical protein
MNDYFPFLFVMVAALVVLSFGEMAISGMWLPAYFRYGIPLFRQEYPLAAMPDLAAKIPELEQRLKRSMWRPAIVFRALNANEIAFRNNFGSRNAMSGLIRLEPNQGRMRISGNLYWTYLLIPFLFVSIVAMGGITVIFLVIMLVIFVMTFGMQRYHYAQIAAVIAATAVIAPPTLQTDLGAPANQSKFQPGTDKPIQPITYEPDIDTYRPATPQTGLSNTEIILLVVLAALLVIGAAAAFLLFG